MSMGARIAIGIVALICGFGFFLTALDTSGLPAKPAVFYGMAILCVIIAIACFFPKSHPLTLRMIGAVIFFAYVAYVVDSFRTSNLFRAIAGFIVWGIPSGYLAIKGEYQFWGTGSEGFNKRQK